MDRPLVARGRDDAARIGRAMQGRGYLPRLVLCSPAARTLQTWEAIAHEIEASPSIDIREALYDAPEGTILACVQDVANSAAVVLCVGHNPGLERFARRMVRTPTDSEERRRCEYLARELATAALAVIDFDAGSWAQIGPARGALSDYITPADLQGG